MDRAKIANDYHENGYSCAQAVACAFHDVIGLDVERIAALQSCYGGGLRAGEVCGVISGAAMVLGARWPHSKLGDQEAKSFGVNVKRDRALVIGSASRLTALVVSISGIIGWVGIVVPHLARMLVGPDFRKLIPTSVSIGICYLLVVDDLCRTLTASEIPLGVITGIIGVPLFLYFIYKKKVSW